MNHIIIERTRRASTSSNFTCYPETIWKTALLTAIIGHGNLAETVGSPAGSPGVLDDVVVSGYVVPDDLHRVIDHAIVDIVVAREHSIAAVTLEVAAGVDQHRHGGLGHQALHLGVADIVVLIRCGVAVGFLEVRVGTADPGSVGSSASSEAVGHVRS